MICKKCQAPGTVILRKNDTYCNECFSINFNHKFRSCIGKNKILSSNEKVMLCLSGGSGSTVLLNLVHNGLLQDIHKKLRITPYCLHIIDSDLETPKTLIELCNKYNFDIYLVHISDFMLETINISINVIPEINNEAVKKFHVMLNSWPPTVYNDFITKIKLNLFYKCAVHLQCNFIFTGETASTLASHLLSDIALGRGSQIQNNVSICDTRNESCTILRPMKDISVEELEHYMKINNILIQTIQTIKSNSLQSIINMFITDMQDNFHSTISTICKTADKIGVNDSTDILGKCVMCHDNINKDNTKLSALKATEFSALVSLHTAGLNHNTCNEEKTIKPQFPFIGKSLCYSCSRNYTEICQSELPDHMQAVLKK